MKINTDRERQRYLIGFPERKKRGSWPAQLVQQVTLDLRLMSSSPTLDSLLKSKKIFKIILKMKKF